ncbi:MAG: shikimate dehydrogenase [Chloroflexi bacterium]|nr:shikimate dehydrogenase [Chloroflexota bacterium]
MSFLGVIGHPLKNSLSPVFQQAALDHLNLGITYEPWSTAADGLETRVTTLRAPTIVGANVTIPHKEAIVPLLDKVDDLARTVGAVNTIVNDGGKLLGYNTDVEGAVEALRRDAGFDPAGKRVVVAGAGGAARAMVVSLLRAKAASIVVINRTFSRATKLVEELQPLAKGAALKALPEMHVSWTSATMGCDLVVNCTSAGSTGTGEEGDSPVPAEAIHAGALVYDIIYRPFETTLMRTAKERGARVLGGLPMLIYQGAASFKLWTGRDAPVEVMFEAARTALKAEDGV